MPAMGAFMEGSGSMDKRLKAGADLLTGEAYKPVKYEAPKKEKTGEAEDQVIFYLPDNERCNPDNLTQEDKTEYNRIIHKALRGEWANNEDNSDN